MCSRKNPFQLIVALDGPTKGELIWDDGDSLGEKLKWQFIVQSVLCYFNFSFIY